MRILCLQTGLFPDAQTLVAALRRLQAQVEVDTVDLARRDLREEDWDRVIDAVLACDLTVTV